MTLPATTGSFHLLEENLPGLIGNVEKRSVTFFLGTDREIGRTQAERAIERRVGVTPAQCGALRRALDACGVGLTVLVHQGAGVRAGYSDHDYIQEGCEMVGREELPFLYPVPDLVHALKEPCPYEADFTAGPFLRIGALHAGGDFKTDGGFHRLARRRDVAVFDGSHVGAPELFRIPIRGSMSIYAGRIAANWVQEVNPPGSHAVIIGGGYAGRAAAREFLRRDPLLNLRIFDRDDPARIEAIRKAFGGDSRVTIHGLGDGLDRPELLQAVGPGCRGLVVCVAIPGRPAPKLFSAAALRAAMPAGSVLVDISIDEGGTIADPALEGVAGHERIIQALTGLLKPVHYRAVANMPRETPHEASIVHGRTILPYLLTLLVLCAQNGGPPGAVRAILSRSIDGRCPDPEKLSGPAQFEGIVQDLRNGLAVWPDPGQAGRIEVGPFLPEAVRKVLAP